ncbi:MAG: NAD(P)H-dependent oxidoreductase [Paludibacteraceae bacterium]|nr:NAD(P)H-dependent oxidoreductase [Paludibacteraceae bacterium]
MIKKIGLLVGSLRKDSWNRKVALELTRLAPSSLQLQLTEIGKLPFYNSDLDDAKSAPESWTSFRSKITEMDALIFITPGGFGAFGANHILRQSMVFLNVPMMQQPEMYLSHINTCFKEDGHVEEKLEKLLTAFLTAFEEWIHHF